MADTLPPEKIASENVVSSDRLQLLKSRLAVAKIFCKKPHQSWKAWIDEYEISDVKDTEEVRDKVRIGYVFRKIEGDQPSMFDDQPDLFFKGRKQAAKEMEPLIETVYDLLWDTQHLDEKIEDVGLYFSLFGMGFIESPYVVKTRKVPQPVLDPMTQQPMIDHKTGEPMMKLLDAPIYDMPDASVPDPFKLFFSSETKFGPRMDYAQCPYYFKKMVMTVDEVKARFGKTVDVTERMKLDDLDVDTEIEANKTEYGPLMEDDLKRVTVYEYYGCLPEDHAKEISADEPWRYDKDYHGFITNNEELQIEECPYERKPLFMVGNYGLANKFWKFGDAKHLMPLIQELQQYRSQILEHTRKMANPKPLLPEGSGIDEAAFRDPRVGRPVKYSGQIAPTYLSPSPLGREVETGVEMARIDLEKTSATFDLSGGTGQSQVKTPRGIQVYSEAADKNTQRKKKKIARLIRDLIIFQFKQIAMMWKPEDNNTLEVLDEDVQVNDAVLQVLGSDKILNKLDIEVESLSVNKVLMKQDAMDLWDIAKESPDVFNLDEIAKDLLQNGFSKKDADRYLLTPEQKAEKAQANAEQPRVNVSVRADATTPPGAAILETSGILPQGMGEQAVVENAQMMDQQAQVQGQQQMKADVMNTAMKQPMLPPGGQGAIA